MVLSHTNQDTASLYGVEHDLPSLACRAAIELDKLIQGREIDAAVIRSLADHIARMVDNRDYLPDTTSVVLIKRAIDGSFSGLTPQSTITELIEQAREISAKLLKLVTDPQPAQAELIKLRSFCLALSKTASAYMQALDDPWLPTSLRV